jgi:hypothetical protein
MGPVEGFVLHFNWTGRVLTLCFARVIHCPTVARAYIVPRDASLFEPGAKFTPDIFAFVKERASHYKQLRGGMLALLSSMFRADLSEYLLI